jgi:hypothetical protein
MFYNSFGLRKRNQKSTRAASSRHSTAVPKQITRLLPQLQIITQHLKTCSAKTYSITSATKNYHTTLKRKKARTLVLTVMMIHSRVKC